MKKIKITLTACAFLLAIGTAFAFHKASGPKANATDWFELDPTTGALITPAVEADLAPCTGGTHFCAGEYNTDVNGNPTGSRIATVKKP